MYIPLHQHSTYSLNDAIGTVQDICRAAKTLGMSAVAITDHGVVKAFPDLSIYSAEFGIKPIFGVEAYFTPDISVRGQKDKGEREYSHLVLLAKTLEGYHNIIKLTSIANTEGFYYKPRIGYKELEKYGSGIICLSACAGGILAAPLQIPDEGKAIDRLKWFKDRFGSDRFYLELQQHDTCAQDVLRLVNPWLIKKASEYGLKTVVTNDSHYINKGDDSAHDIVLCKRHNKKITDKDHKYFYDGSFYFKDENEMLSMFPDNHDAVHQSGIIADMIDHIDPQAHVYNFPQAELNGEWLSEDRAAEVINDRTYTELVRRKLTSNWVGHDGYELRRDDELRIIKEFGFSNYLLVMADLLNWCKGNGIPVGPGRGSAVNCLTNYLLGITSIDPIKYDLDFARFLNEGRIRIDPDTGEKTFTSMIDIDVDISKDGRIKFLKHVQKKYGNVYHMGNDIRYTAKTALKTAGSAMGKAFPVMTNLTKLIIEKQPGTDILISISDNMKKATVAKFVAQNKLTDVVIRAEGLEGGLSGEGTHASGIVISNQPIDHIVPIRRGKDDESTLPVIDFNMKEVENLCRQIKFDFLGLRNISVIDEAEKIIKSRFTTAQIPEYGDFSDTSIYGAKFGLDNVFQLGSNVATAYYRKISPTNEEELCDVIALIRPGTLTAGWADKYADGGYRHKIARMNQLLKKTRGIMVYQEQMMEVAKDIAGFTSAKADDLRKFIGKKKIKELASLLNEFTAGAIKNGFTAEDVEYIINQLKDAGLYSFNKGHSIGYAAISYKTLWLKHYYPVEFYCAVLNSEMRNADNLKGVIQNIKENGISIVPPDINTSTKEAIVNGNSIMLGLEMIKGIGGKAIDHIIENRPYVRRLVIGESSNSTPISPSHYFMVASALEDFILRTPKRTCNMKSKAALAYAGALDSLCGDRAKAISLILEKKIDYDLSDLAVLEKSVLGAFFSQNPFSSHPCFQTDIMSPTQLSHHLVEQNTEVVGFVEDFKILQSKATKNDYMPGTITDGDVVIKFIAFKSAVARFSEVLKLAKERSTPVILSGKWCSDDDKDDPNQYKLCIFDSGDIRRFGVSDRTIGIEVNVEDMDDAVNLIHDGDERLVILSKDHSVRKTMLGSLDSGTIKTLEFMYNARVGFFNEDD